MVEQGRSFSGRERNCCFLNTSPGGRFATISALTGADFPDDGRALALVDWDHDGYTDLVVSNRNAPRIRLLRNNYPHINHFLAISLQGNGTTCNRDAIGARVEVLVKGLNNKRLVKSVRAGDGFLSQSSKCLNFGLAQHDVIDKIKVHWPTGGVEEFAGVEINRRYRLEQGTSRAVQVSPRQTALVLKPSPQEPLPAPACIPVPLVSPLPMPRDLHYIDFDDKKRRFPYSAGKPTLIVLWASWCKPCHTELIELAARIKEIQAAGIEVVALSVDGMNEDDGSTPGADKAFCKQRKIPFAVGKASSALTACIMWYHHTMVVMNLQLPIPLSVMVNAQGQMTDIYKGKVSVDDILRDAQRRPTGLYERRMQAQCFPGTMIDHEGLMSSHRLMEANTYFTLGNSYAKDQLDDIAIEYFHLALESDPTYVDAYKELAIVLDRLGRDSESLAQLMKAIRLKPERASLHLVMGEIHNRKGRFPQARVSYLEALRLDPSLEDARKQLSRLNLQLR